MRQLVCDNFAGGGGASTGIEAAIGRAIDVAINHDPEAIAMHLANHVATKHFCQSIMAVDPLAATGGASCALVWFSPDCKHHSKAKGGKPREKNIRDLAWIVPHWAERLLKGTPEGLGAPKVLMLENVEEFRQWGPLDPDGMPIKDRMGEEFQFWVRQLKRLGYKVEWRELRACDYGAPTSRKRLYLIARRDGRPIVWPEPTHGKPGSPEVESGQRKPWRTAAECIDWSIPCPSIFDRKRPLKEATNRRIAHGVMRYVVNAAKPFIVRTDHGDDGHHRTHPISSPLGTIVAGGIKHGLVVANLEKFSENSRGRPAGEPLDTVMAGAPRHGLVTTFLSHFYSSNTNGGQGDPLKPAKTVTSEGQHHAVVAAHIEQANTGGMLGRAADKPITTVTASGAQQRLVETTMVDADALPPEMLERAVKVAAFLIKYYGNKVGGHGMDAPIGTVTT